MAGPFRRKQKPLLTAGMTKILALHASGLTLKEIAQKIFVSYSAVTNTMYDARSRVNADTTAELIMKAHDLGYLSHPTGPDGRVIPLDPFASAAS
jgi:DNA-binding NarL/FixJ family response regulator